MAEFMFSNTEIVGGFFFVAIGIFAFVKFFERKDRQIEIKVEDYDETLEEEKRRKERLENKNLTKLKKANTGKKKDTAKELSYSHEWLLTSLKGHSGQILDLDFSPNGKYLASCGDDRQVMLWTVKTFTEKNYRWVRANIEYDHATKVKWSPDGKAFIAAVANENAIQVHKLSKKKDGVLGNVEVINRFQVHHNNDIINIGIACNGLFIMSCSSDTNMVIWSLKGDPLATIDTLNINNYYACVSPCGRFVASSGFTPDVRVWEVCFSKTGEFKEVKRAFELKGHSSGIYQFSFSNDSSRMATISKDGTWKLWDTNVEYTKGQEPYLIRSCIYSKSPVNSLIALSSDGKTVAICMKSDLLIYSADSGELQATLPEIHTEHVCSLLFSPEGQYVAATAGRHIRIFKNILGYRNTMSGFEEAKKRASNATMRERLQSQIDGAKSALKVLEETIVK